ncbi:MAG: hypothetical protein ACOCRN_00015 [Spirochaetia bacterium]
MSSERGGESRGMSGPTGNGRHSGNSEGSKGPTEGQSERERLETLLDSGRLSAVLGDDTLPRLDACSPLAALVAALSDSSEEVDIHTDSLSMETLWRAARGRGLPVSTAVTHAIHDEVRARAFGRLLERWEQVPAADRRGTAAALVAALPDPDTPALFLGALQKPLMKVARDAAIERERGILGAPSGTESAAASDSVALPDSADSPRACETLVEALETADTGQAYQIISRLAAGGADAIAWLTYASERDYALSRAMIHRLRALMRLDISRAVRLAGGLFRADEHRGDVSEDIKPLYAELLDLLLESGAPEIYPLLVFIFEPGGQMALPREEASQLRERIRGSSAFRSVRRFLRRLQRGEPVLVPSGTEFEDFVNAELRRLGYTSGSPDPQVIVDVRTRWQQAMHEDLLYLRPVDIPEVSLEDILGEPQAGESIGKHVEQQSSEDPEWILKPAEGEELPRIVEVYRRQESVYREAGLTRLHERQRQFTVRDLVVRGARAFTEHGGEGASRYASAAAGLDPADPFAVAFHALVDGRQG